MSGPIDTEIKDSEKFELTGSDILRIIQNNGKVMSYSKLERFDDIDSALEPYGAIVLLYEVKKNYGHWVCLFRRGKNTLEFFDPYGLKVDEELGFQNNLYMRESYDGGMPHLTYLLKKSKYNVVHNPYKFQRTKEDVNTCGRHCAVRLRFRDTPIDEYHELMTTNKCYDADWFVSAMTILI